MCNNSTHLLPGVRMQIKLTKARRAFYLMNKYADSKVELKFLDAQQLVNRVRQNPAYILAHNTTLQAGGLARYYLTRVELKTFTFPN
jgi:histidinol dehydrogenase